MASSAAFPRRSSLPREQLHRLYSENKRELTKHVSTAVGAREQFFGGSDWYIRWYEAPRGAEHHNGLEHQDLPVREMAAAIDMLMARYGERQFTWVTGPYQQTPLEHFLKARNFTLDETEPVMVADLSTLHLRADAAAALDGVVVSTVDVFGVEDWARAWAYGAPASDMRHWALIYKTLIASLHPKQFRMFVAKKDGQTIGTAYIHCFGGVAAVHALCVVPGFRRRGVGKALLATAMREAAALGYNVATLTASPSGMHLFRSMGFEEFGTVRLYMWRPLKAADVVKPKSRAPPPQSQPQAAQVLAAAVEPAKQEKDEHEDEDEWELVEKVAAM